MYTQKLKFGFGLLGLLLLLLVGSLLYLALASLPQAQGKQQLTGLTSSVTVNSDHLGIPSILASNRQDAFHALGFLHARDRLFQMDLMRRKSAGQLAEIFGAKAVKLDKSQRDYQFSKAAEAIVAALPAPHKAVLNAYVAGVNAFLAQAKILAPEFIALNYRPQPWKDEDSILVALGMFQTLNGQEQDERMLSVMEKALPQALVKFLTPDTDLYAQALMGGMASHRPAQAIPVSDFSALNGSAMDIAQGNVDTDSSIAGSNNWVVSGNKTKDGRAIIANDMHLGLNAPTIWYRAELRYGAQYLNGVTLPGLPALIIGSNQDVAWGFTNATADLLDLISLDINPANPQQYLSPQGWRNFNTRTEIIKVKDAADIAIEFRSTHWGPVSSQTLLGKPVAIRWTALDAAAVDLGLLDMDSATSTKAAMSILNQAGGPPQNVVVADRAGHIGWTLMGRFPKRKGFDGLSSQSWSDAGIAWDGYIPSAELPQLFDPPGGYIATANNRTLGGNYPYVLGYNWALSYRSYRINELLQQGKNLNEQDLLEMQLDTRSHLFDFYQQLALAAIDHSAKAQQELAETIPALKAWDGHMHSNSKSAALLIAFRTKLAEGAFTKVVARCRQLDPNFKYAWREMETPLRELLTRRPKQVLPAPYKDDWDLFILQALKSATEDLAQEYPQIKPNQLNWGRANLISQQHPFSKSLPILATLLDYGDFESDGCPSFCVKVMSNNHGASERMVLSPAHPEQGILEMPGGQSGHPLSRHYRDQQQAWQTGRFMPFLPGQTLATLYLEP